MIKYPPGEYATVKIPRDPELRARAAAELARPALMGRMQIPYAPKWMPQGQWRGRGDYSQLWGATEPLRKMAGSWLRKGDAGTWRKAAGDFMGYTGIGDYSAVIDNSLVGQGVASAGIPLFGPEQQNYTVSKAEFIQNIYAPTVAGSFQNLVLPLNPGLPQTFPWLSLVAPQFEEYEFEQLMFYWRPMVSDFNSTTGQVGEIVMATQYNPSEASFTDISRAKNYMGAMSAKTSSPMNQGVECDPRKNSGAPGKYVRLGPLTGTNADLKQYDQGNLNVMVSGTPPAYSDQILGELWVTYTVTLRKPKLPDTSGSAILRDYFQSSTTMTPATPTSLTAIIAAPMLYGAQNRLQGRLRWIPLTSSGYELLRCEYVFPDWFNGAAEIDINFIGVSTGPSGAAYETSVNGAWEINYVGQVTGIPDIGTLPTAPPGVPTFSFSSAVPLSSDGIGCGLAAAGVAAPQNFSARVHVQVGENTTGTDNAVVIGTLSYATGTAPTVAGWTVNVQEYNTAFNSTATGQPLLVDVEGNSVLSPWAVL